MKIRFLVLLSFLQSCENQEGNEVEKNDLAPLSSEWSSLEEAFNGGASSRAIRHSMHPKLEKVELVNVVADEEDFEYISKLKKLKVLRIGELPGGEKILDLKNLNRLKSLVNLEELYLSISDAQIEHLKFIFEMDKLKILHIEPPFGTNLKITKDYAEKISKMGQLESLHILNSGIGEDLKRVMNVDRLKSYKF